MNSSCSNFSSVSLVLSSRNIFPAGLKILSTGADDVGIDIGEPWPFEPHGEIVDFPKAGISEFAAARSRGAVQTTPALLLPDAAVSSVFTYNLIYFALYLS